jgi:hypothetical protein
VISEPPTTHVAWRGAVRIIRSLHPPIDLFEDIADPADWALLISAEQKTNPRLMETIGNLDNVPLDRRVAGQGASYLMAPFTHASTDRPSRFTSGSYGVLYAGERFEVSLFETIHHHAAFMARTNEKPGWTSQYREIILDIDAHLNAITDGKEAYNPLLDPDDYTVAQEFAVALRKAGSEGIIYPSVRALNGNCAALFYPNSAANARQGRRLDYHWDGERVDYCREAGVGKVFAIV